MVDGCNKTLINKVFCTSRNYREWVVVRLQEAKSLHTGAETLAF